MNRGGCQSSPVQQMIAGNPNWWSINSMRPPSTQPSMNISPFFQPPPPLPPNFLIPQFAPSNNTSPSSTTSSSGLAIPSWHIENNNQELPESWSHLLLGGIVGEDEKGAIMRQFHQAAKKLENWEEQILNSTQAPNASVVDVKQENSGNSNGFVYGHHHGNDHIRGFNPSAAASLSQIMQSTAASAASSPKSSCVTSFSNNNILDFSSKSDVRHPPPHRSSDQVSMDFDGLPDGDEMHSSDDVNEAKKRKGRGPTMLDYNALSKAKQIGVQFNDKGQHFGAGSASLSSSAGILARQLIPVTYASWDEVPTILKDKLWAAVKQKYDLAPCRKKILLTQMSGCWRTYKATLTKQIRSLDDGPDAMEQMQLLKPANIEKQADWDKFVKHRCSPEFDAISEKFKKLKSFHTLPHVMSRKGYARLEDELRNKGTPEEDLNRVSLWIAARTRKNGQPVNEIVSKKMDDIKLANEMPTTDNGSIKDDALSQALGPEHRGRLRGGGYGVTPSRYDAQTYASMSNRELRDRLQNVEGKLREVFDLVLAKQQNEGNGKETNTNDAIQVSTNRPQSQGGCIDLQRTKNGVKQVPNSSYQVSRSSPQLQCNKKSAPEANDCSRHTSKASSQIQCDRRSAQEADDASRQASKASSQK